MGRNRILSCAFALVLAFGLMPTTAFAAQEDAGATLEARDNDSLSNATTINVGATVTGALVDGYDDDFYRFSLSSAGVVTLTFGTEFVDENKGWTVYLRDQNGDDYDRWNVYRSNVGDFTTQQVGLPAGTYYVQVAPRGTTTATYHLRVNFEQRGDWETEYNDNRSDADAISVNSLYYGSIFDGYDDDFYRFSLSSAGVVTLTFGTEFVDENKGWTVYLRDQNGDDYDRWNVYRSNVGDFTTQQVGLPAGTYYVQVAPRGTTTATYHLRVNAANEPSPGSYGFVDVSPSDWYATDDVLGYAVDHGLLSGYGNKRFGPYDSVTRGQMATILWRVAGEPGASAQLFSDVDYSQYYGDAIRWARSTGVISGYGDTNTFRPDDPVTREQLCVMLANYAEKVARVSTATNCVALDRIAGADQVSSWAREQMGWAVDEGIISGEATASGTWVNPQGNAQRCAVAKMASVFHRDVLGLG